MPLIGEGGLLNIVASVVRITLPMLTLSAGFIGDHQDTLTPLGRPIVRNYHTAGAPRALPSEGQSISLTSNLRERGNAL